MIHSESLLSVILALHGNPSIEDLHTHPSIHLLNSISSFTSVQLFSSSDSGSVLQLGSPAFTYSLIHLHAVHDHKTKSLGPLTDSRAI
jgi:hypothetical protein